MLCSMTPVDRLRAALNQLPDKDVPGLARRTGIPTKILRRFRDGRQADLMYLHTMALRRFVRKGQVIA